MREDDKGQIYLTSTEDLKELDKYLLSGSMLAQVVGLTTRYVQNLNGDGIFKSGGRGKGYPLLDCVKSYCEYMRNKSAGKPATDKEAELKQKKLEAEIALKESQGELHRLKTDIQAGRFIAVEDVKLDYDRFFVIFKKFALAIPSRVSVLLNGIADPVTIRAIERDLLKEVQSMLDTFVSSAQSEEKAE